MPGMTEQERNELRQITHESVQDENGIDVTQIDHLLSISPTDRLRTLEEFLNEDDALMRQAKRVDAQAPGTDRAVTRRQS